MVAVCAKMYLWLSRYSATNGGRRKLGQSIHEELIYNGAAIPTESMIVNVIIKLKPFKNHIFLPYISITTLYM